MRYLTIDARRIAAVAVAALLLPLGLGACDSATPASEVTVQGAVTTQQGYDTDDGPDSVEEARVSAAEVSSSGQLLALSGEATSDSDGRYSLTTETTTRPVVVRAETEGFEGSVAFEADAFGGFTTAIVQAPPITAESTAEAGVFVASRTEASAVTVADVSAHVSSRTATSIGGGDLTTADLAAALGLTISAERSYALHVAGAGGAQLADQARSERRAAHAQFRTDIAAATTLQQRRAAVNIYLDAYARAHATSGLSYTASAEASLTASGAAQRFAAGASTQARFVSAHRARVIAALATALAVEEEFRVAGASQARLDVLAQARTSLISALHASASAAAMASAWTEYRGTVRTELATELGVSPGSIDAAFAATAAARATLDAAVAAAAHAEAVVAAYAAYFAAAREAVETELGAGAELAVTVIATVAAF